MLAIKETRWFIYRLYTLAECGYIKYFDVQICRGKSYKETCDYLGFCF